MVLSPIHRPLWAEVSVVRFDHNLRQIRSRIGTRTLFAVMKADAYGHGAAPLCTHAAAVADAIAVASVEEALLLREAGYSGRLLVLGYTPPAAFEEAQRAGLELTLVHLKDAQEFSRLAQAAGTRLPAHVKIDTGMSRLGVPHGGLQTLLLTMLDLPGLDITAAFSHLAASDDPDEPFNDEQLRRLLTLREHPRLKKLPLHLANSGGVLFHTDTLLDGVRPGILCYGLSPMGTAPPPPDFQPVMRLCTRVVELRTVEAGDTVSYNRTFKATGPRRIATLPVGYADGMLRSLSGRGMVLVSGQRAPMVGRVCMDFLMVDVTDVRGGVKIGQEVTLFGEQEGETLGAGELAHMAGTINYELVSLIGKRVPRVYTNT